MEWKLVGFGALLVSLSKLSVTYYLSKLNYYFQFILLTHILCNTLLIMAETTGILIHFGQHWPIRAIFIYSN